MKKKRNLRRRRSARSRVLSAGGLLQPRYRDMTKAERRTFGLNGPGKLRWTGVVYVFVSFPLAGDWPAATDLVRKIGAGIRGLENVGSGGPFAPIRRKGKRTIHPQRDVDFRGSLPAARKFVTALRRKLQELPFGLKVEVCCDVNLRERVMEVCK